MRDHHFGQTPLYWPIRGRHEAVVQLLLRQGANTEVRNKRGRTPLHFAAGGHRPNVAVIRLLLDHGADFEVEDDEQRQPLSWGGPGRKRRYGSGATRQGRQY